MVFGLSLVVMFFEGTWEIPFKVGLHACNENFAQMSEMSNSSQSCVVSGLILYKCK